MLIPLRLCVNLLSLVAFAASARADIFQWEYINPADPSQGKRQSTTLAPDGAGVDAVAGAELSYRNLMMAYLIGADLTGADGGFANLTNADLSQANLRVIENGQPQPSAQLVQLRNPNVPVSVALALDVSGSMADEDKLPQARQAALRFIQQMRSRDQIALVLNHGDLSDVDGVTTRGLGGAFAGQRDALAVGPQRIEHSPLRIGIEDAAFTLPCGFRRDGCRRLDTFFE